MKHLQRVEPFLYSSSKQVLSYLQYMNYKIPRDRKTGKPTTGEDELEKLTLRTEDPVLPLVLRCRRLQKAGTYLAETYVGRDGRFHPTYSNNPKTGRLASSSPNLQNVPQGRKPEEVELAVAIRSTIIPSPGHVFIEADWTGVEALLVGYFAKDPDYMRLARLGVHDCMTSHVVGKPADLSWDDVTLKAYLQTMKKGYPEIRPKSKKTVHARGYGEGARAIARDLGITQEEAQRLIGIYEQMAPRIKEWQLATRMRAHKDGFLRNPFGMVLRFYDVFRKDPRKGGWKLGDEANEALSFLPQSTGAGMLRKTILRYAKEREQVPFLHALVPVHDAILFEAEVSRFAESVRYVSGLMQRPFEELDGLWCGCEIKAGPAWSEMEVVDPEALQAA